MYSCTTFLSALLRQQLGPTVSAVTRASVLIVGLGNPLRGDDGFGARVIEELAKEALPNGTQLLDAGTAGLELVLEWMGREAVLVVDAGQFDGSPGEVRRFDLLACALPHIDWSLGHAHGLAASVELAKALGACPRHLDLYAVEPLDTSEPHRLSNSVEQAIPLVVSLLLDHLSSLLAG